MAPSVLGLGDNTIDTYVDLGRQFPGGNAVNVAVLARRMGADAAYLGCFGEDAAGAALIRALAAERIDTSRCRRVAGANARAFIAHNDGDRRFIRSERGVRGAWGVFGDDDLAYIARYDLVHSSVFSELEPHLDALRPAIRRWSYDLSERWTRESLAALAPRLDAVFLSSPKASDEECADLARWCAELGPRAVVVTRGARGAVAVRDGDVLACAPRPTRVVDTLGAGDAFIAAFLIADFQNAPLAEALDRASRAAAQTCERMGAFGYGETWAPAA